jgi:beta-lactamase superfamily II metal-dependent hydrolase
MNAARRAPRKGTKTRSKTTTAARAKNIKSAKRAPARSARGGRARSNARVAGKRARGPRKAASGSAAGLKVRMYRVGFGDFFLITVPTGAEDRFILVDCGVFKGTSGKGDIGTIEEAVEDLYKTTGGDLALVIMTHRHADHIAGFSLPQFKDFKASLVWMPYWEQEEAKAAAASKLQLDVANLALQLGMQFRGRTDPKAQLALDQLWNATGIDFNAAAKAGAKGRGNAAALDLLKKQLGANGKNVRYYAAGDTAELPEELAGVLQAQILGPPPRDALAFLQMMDLTKGVGQYLDSLSGSEAGGATIRPFGSHWAIAAPEGYPAKDPKGYPIDYRQISRLVATAQPDMLAAAAAKIDNYLNNQSLVVLFTFGGKKLLFVGDAQAGNWQYWLYHLSKPTKDPRKAGSIVPESQEILQTIDFYKVGHHGSTNATPISVVEALGEDHSADGFVAMCSTQSDTYGSPDKGTEVPRVPLLDKLGKECALVRSDQFAVTTSSGTIDATTDAKKKLPTPKTGKLVKGNLYVEYQF